MKRTIYIIALLLITGYGHAQFQCVSCNENEIDFEKYASGIGLYNIATGSRSFVGGEKSQALGNYSLAFGQSTMATGEYSFSFGNGSRAIGLSSFSFGLRSQALGDYSFAFGSQAKADGVYSFAYGEGAQANGMYSVVMGRQSKAMTEDSYVLGYKNTSQAPNSYMFGSLLTTTASKTVTIGAGAGGGTSNLTNTIASSMMVGFNSNVPTFFVGGSSGEGTTGKSGFGNIIEPEAKLHILGDAGPVNADDASLFIQSAGIHWSTFWLGDKSHYIKSRPNEDFIFKIESGDDFVFDGGNVGIGTETPDYKLDVEGSINFTGQLHGPDGLIKPSMWTLNSNDIYYNGGNVGIGISTPMAKLDIQESVSHNYALHLMHTNDNWGNGLLIESNGGWSDDILLKIVANKNGTPRDVLYVEGTGKIGIGTTEVQDGYILSIDGKVIAEEVKIQNSDEWYDFVFDEGYDLPKLTDLDSYIKQNKHLPDVPTAKEVAENGYELGKMNGILLKKVEELTLYVIEQQKEIEKLKEIMNNRQ